LRVNCPATGVLNKFTVKAGLRKIHLKLQN